MSNTIDERVVRMQFDNKQFEKGIAESSASLKKLDKTLSDVEKTKYGQNVSKETEKVTEKMVSATDSVGKFSKSFNALEEIATGALRSLGEKIEQTVSKYTGQFTFKQISAGWQKYAKKTEAIQTIMAATAEGWEEDAVRIYGANKSINEALTQGIDDRTVQEYANEIARLKNLYKDEGEWYEHYVKNSAKKRHTTPETLLESFEKVYGDGLQTIRQGGELPSQMEYVNDQIEKLSTFTDETSYNFTDMVSNIGKFTSAGVSLSEAVSSMQGIATWAASAGANATTASRAMYNISQAMGSGTMRAIDWASIENANMATKEFKDTVIQTALELGTLTQKSNGVYYGNKKIAESVDALNKGFKDTLQKGWFDKDVMSETFKKYGDFADQLSEFENETDLAANTILKLVDAQKEGRLSEETLGEYARDANMPIEEFRQTIEELASDENTLGEKAYKAAQEAKTFEDAINSVQDAASSVWMNIFEQIFGDYEKAKVVWTDFANWLYSIFVEPIYPILGVLKEWNNATEDTVAGQDIFIDALRQFGIIVSNITQPIKDAFSEIFGTFTGNDLKALTIKFRSFMHSLAVGSEEAGDGIYGAFKGIFSIIKAVFGIFKSLFNIVKPIWKALGSILGIVIDVAGDIGELVSGFLNGEAAGFIFAKIIGGITKVLTKLATLIGTVVAGIREFVNSSDFVETLFGVFETLHSLVAPIFDTISAKVDEIWATVEPFLPTSEEISASISNTLTELEEILPTTEQISNVLENIWNFVKGIFGDLWGLISPYLEQVRDKIVSVFHAISDFITGFVNAEDKLEYLKEHFRELFNAFKEFKKKSKVLNFLRNGMVTVSSAIKSLAEHIRTFLGSIDGNAVVGLTYFITTMSSLIFIGSSLKKFTNIFDNFTTGIKKSIKGLNRLTLFVGVTALILSLSKLITVLKDFSSLSLADMGKTIGALIAILGALAGMIFVMKTMIGSGLGLKTVLLFGGVLAAFSAVLLLAAFSLKTIASACPDQLIIKVIGVVILLGAMLGALYLLTKMNNKIQWKDLLVMTLVGIVFAALAFAISKIANIPTDMLQNGSNNVGLMLIVMGVITAGLIALGIFLKQAASAFIAIATLIGSFAASFAVVTFTILIVEKFGKKLSGSDIGVFALALGVIAILVGFGVAAGLVMNKMGEDSGKQFTKFAGAVLSMSVAIAIISLAIVAIINAISKSKYGVTSFAKIMYAFGGMILALGVCAVLIGTAARIAGKDGSMRRAAKSLIPLILGVQLILVTLFAMTKLGFGSLTDVLPYLETVGIILGGLAVVMLILGAANRLAGPKGIKSGPIVSLLLGLIGIMLAINLLTKDAERANNAKDIIALLWFLMGTIALIFLAIGRANKLSGQNGMKTGPILAMFAGIATIMFAFVVLSSMPDQNRVMTAGLLIIGILGMVALIAFAMGYMISKAQGFNFKTALGIFAGLIAVIAAMGVFVIGVMVLQNVPIKTVLSVAAGMAAVAISFAVAIRILSKIDNPRKALAGAVGMLLVAVALSAVILAISVVAQSGMNGGKMWNVIGMIATLSVLFGAVIVLTTKYMDGFYKPIIAISGMAVMALALGALILVLSKVANSGMEGGKMWNLIGMIAVLTLLFGAVAVLVSRLSGNFLKTGVALAGMLGIAVIMGALMGFLSYLSKTTDVDKLKKMVGQMALVILVLVAAAAVLGLGAGLFGIGAVVLVVLAAAVFIIVQAMAKLAEVMPLAMDALKLFVQTIAEFGNCIGAIFKGAVAMLGLMIACILLGIGLTAAGIGLAIFGAGAWVVVEAITALVESLGKLANGVSSIIAVFKGEKATEGLEEFTKEAENAAAASEELAKPKEVAPTFIPDPADSLPAKGTVQNGSTGKDAANSILGMVGGKNGVGGGLEALTGGLSSDSLKGGIMGFLGDLLNGGDLLSAVDMESLQGQFGDLLGGMDLSGGLTDMLGNMDFGKSFADSGALKSLTESLTEGVSSVDLSESANEQARNYSESIDSSENRAKANNAGYSLGTSAKTGIGNVSFNDAGKNSVAGFLLGLKDDVGKQNVYNAGWDLGNTALRAIKAVLNEASPSKAFKEVGMYADQGFAIGIEDNTSDVEEASYNMGKNAMASTAKAIADAINGEYNSPVIRPTLDLTNVRRGASEVSSMFSNSSLSANVDETAQNGSGSGTSYNFVQNNYSPKALSRIEIYRQTKNQFALARGVV